VRFGLIAAHFEHPFTSNSNLDLVAFFEIARIITSFRYLHQPQSSPVCYFTRTSTCLHFCAQGMCTLFVSGVSKTTRPGDCSIRSIA